MRRSTVLLSMLFLLFSVVAVLPVAAESLSTVTVDDRQVSLTATTGVDQVRYFTLDSPKRLVVDFYGVTPGSHAQEIPLSAGFAMLRTGTLENRTRFVFDVAGEQFPTFNVATGSDGAIVTWEAAQTTTFAALAEPATQGSAKIDAIDFRRDNGESRLMITISGQTRATTPERDGNKVQFSLPNTTLPRALRREFDTLAYPSALHSATPYLVNAAGRPEVRMVVLLKGDVDYRLEKVTGGYAFIVNDGIYSQTSPVVSGTTALSAPGKRAGAPAAPATAAAPVPVVTATGQPHALTKYSGEKTSLVFDNAEVRDILRLIAEISDLNIIASDDVSGNVTLRLIDVPWDQALDLIPGNINQTQGNVAAHIIRGDDIQVTDFRDQTQDITHFRVIEHQGGFFPAVLSQGMRLSCRRHHRNLCRGGCRGSRSISPLAGSRQGGRPGNDRGGLTVNDIVHDKCVTTGDLLQAVIN
ncbi:MAG: AMIN domain-containing protein, partial [Pelovirga sp.]